MAKKKTVKKLEKDNNKDKKDIVYLFLLPVFILLFVFTISEKTGYFGTFFRSISFFTFGSGAYIFPILLIINTVLAISKKVYGKNLLNIIYMYSLFFYSLIIIDIWKNEFFVLNERLNYAIELSYKKSGGGVLGSFLSFTFSKFFGITGTYTIGIILITFSLFSFFNLSFKDIGNEIKKMFSSYSDRKKEKLNDLKDVSDLQKSNEIKNEFNEERETEYETFEGRINARHNIKTYKEMVENWDKPKEKKSKKSARDLPFFIKNERLSKEEDEELDEKSAENGLDNVEVVNVETDLQNTSYEFPSISLLNENREKNKKFDKKFIINNAELIEKTMKNFGISAKIVNINKGPAVTCYELQPAPGVKVSRIVNLADDLALSLASSGIRIEAPIPGKSAVGIEVPNKEKESVYLKDIIDSKEFEEIDSKLPLALGKSISGDIIISTIDKMPHLLIAGATGSGKSVCINSIIVSILYKAKPSEVKMILIDPKMVELNIYNKIPHLAIPVVTNAKKAGAALSWAVMEMERRYQIFSENHVRDIKSYKKKSEDENLEKLPYIVIIIDELSDLMMVSAKEVEDYICRLAQMARACGIHLIVATQRPSVDVITGTIKTNIPSRIAFSVSSQVDSRTILDMSGAEKLLGKGDMLFYPSGYSKPLRVQGAFVTDSEVERICDFIKTQKINREYDDIKLREEIEKKISVEKNQSEDLDELFDEAVKVVLNEKQASISLLQRRLKIGYARAGRLIDEMESMGIVGSHEGSKPRKILIDETYFENESEDLDDEYSK